MLKGSIYGKIIYAKNITALKRLASIEANKRYNPYDLLYVVIQEGLPYFTYTRINKKSPNNTIIRGQWG